MLPPLRARSRLGKYRIVRRLGEGGFADVYEALDTVEGIPVALKVPRIDQIDEATLKQFRMEARVNAELDHPNILPVKNADVCEGRFIIAYRLGLESLADRLGRRVATATLLDFAEQMIEALSFAHAHYVMHCDLKPENFILFPDNLVRLGDFGIAKVALRTVQGSGSGTIGYLSPEQALGRTSFRSDVFSLGLIIYEMFAGAVPQWPFEWPGPGYDRLKKKAHPELIALLQRCLHINPARRFADATQVKNAWQKLRPKARRFLTQSAAKKQPRKRKESTGTDWKLIRFRQCRKEHGKALHLDRDCRKCGGPMSEHMQCCPWCGVEPRPKLEAVSFPARCPRCKRGRKLDWQFCAWCYGGRFDEVSTRAYQDRRYEGRCGSCSGSLLPFARYCPWCRRKTTTRWRISSSRDRCKSCGWGVLKEYWHHCPWCAKSLTRRGR